ncbi:MAG TPA: response regulator transcription factor [Acidimicrobiia bacterium]|nr:response regulator transcription factor [Acidimicrobiia bacterium]
MTSILVVEDDAPLRRALRTSLRARDLEVHESTNGEDALVLAADRRPDLVLLDLGLPGIDGIETLGRLRAFSDVPVIVLTARDRAADKVAALDAGADDYVTKPFDADELLARVRAALRRSPQTGSGPSVVQCDGLEIDLVQRRVRLDGTPVHLTRTELALLEVLVRNPGKLLAHDYLLRQVWGQGYGGQSNYLRVYVRQLRRKLGDDATNPRLILTEPGIGYRWIADA